MESNKNLLAFGAGVGLGLLSLWAIIELAPIVAFGGVGYLIATGLVKSVKEE